MQKNLEIYIYRDTFNQTKVELKSALALKADANIQTFNQTKVELKLRIHE